MNNGAVRAFPFLESGISTGWDVPQRSAGNDLEECMVHLFEIRFEVILNVDNESGCDRRE